MTCSRPDMTYNVFGRTLNLTLLQLHSGWLQMPAQNDTFNCVFNSTVEAISSEPSDQVPLNLLKELW